MKVIDLNKLEVALTYVQRMAEGNNPGTYQPAAEDDVLNNPNVIRCMYFIRDVFAQAQEFIAENLERIMGGEMKERLASEQEK